LAATLFGTNKYASLLGTLNVTWRYAWQVKMRWRTILLAALTTFVFPAWAPLPGGRKMPFGH